MMMEATPPPVPFAWRISKSKTTSFWLHAPLRNTCFIGAKWAGSCCKLLHDSLGAPEREFLFYLNLSYLR